MVDLPNSETTKASMSRSRNSNLLSNGDNDNSDNSGDNSGTGQLSLWNNSFGFNFDSEFTWSPPNSDSGTPDDDTTLNNGEANTNISQASGARIASRTLPSEATERGMTQVSLSNSGSSTQMPRLKAQNGTMKPATLTQGTNNTLIGNKSLKSSGESGSDISNGYKSDDDESRTTQPSGKPVSNKRPNMSPLTTKDENDDESVSAYPRKKQRSTDQSYDDKREERNKREKERSYRITSQINELRALLTAGGVVVSKGTKNAVLAEAASYIRMLQQNQYKAEIHRQQLIQQMQLIGTGQLGPHAANAIRYAAAQNGLWNLGDFGGLPPNTGFEDPQSTQSDASEDQLINTIQEHDYKHIFNSCSVGMAIASMGGAFIDCNHLFLELSGYSKEEICSLTIFNLTSKEDLQSAFDLISQMISPPADSENNPFSPCCVLRGSMKHRRDLGLNITLIKDKEGIAKCFCVSLIKNPSSPFDDSPPVHATAATLLVPSEKNKQEERSVSAFRATG